MRQEEWQRDISKLHIHNETRLCAEKGCLPCCYKIVVYQPHGGAPNQRPECCPRYSSFFVPHCNNGLYTDGMKILLVGDGNFSFSLSLANSISNPKDIVSTSYESQQTVLKTYPETSEILKALYKKNVNVCHGIDATDAKTMRSLGQFDRIIWNFPCIRMENGFDGQNEQMEENKNLLMIFFSHISHCLLPGGQVHVTHKTKGPFYRWNLVSLAQNSNLIYTGAVIFDRSLFPGYISRKVLSCKSFPMHDSQTYIFSEKASSLSPLLGSLTLPLLENIQKKICRELPTKKTHLAHDAGTTSKGKKDNTRKKKKRRKKEVAVKDFTG